AAPAVGAGEPEAGDRQPMDALRLEGEEEGPRDAIGDRAPAHSSCARAKASSLGRTGGSGSPSASVSTPAGAMNSCHTSVPDAGGSSSSLMATMPSKRMLPSAPAAV